MEQLEEYVPSTQVRLCIKINAIIEEMGALQPDGHNDYSDYDYISSDQMLGILRKFLPKYKITILPSITGFEEKNFVSNDKVVIRTQVRQKYQIIDLETGHVETLEWCGADQDTGGKSGGQAITECTKRFFFKLFHVSSKEEVDPDSKTTDIKTSASSSNLQPSQQQQSGHQDGPPPGRFPEQQGNVPYTPQQPGQSESGEFLDGCEVISDIPEDYWDLKRSDKQAWEQKYPKSKYWTKKREDGVWFLVEPKPI